MFKIVEPKLFSRTGEIYILILIASYIKDSQHALEMFRDVIFPNQKELIFTMDITSLYIVSPNDEGVLALKAIGTKVGPSCASNLFVEFIELQFFNEYNGGPEPEPYGRYIDDCIGTISSARQN